MKSILVTGGSGFIGSNFIRFVFEKTSYAGSIVNVDILSYAGSIRNLEDVDRRFGDRYRFVRADICDRKSIRRVFHLHSIDTVVHFAAETHVDKSIDSPASFVTTNVLGTQNLLECSRNAWSGNDGVVFHQVSTDEVYGSLGPGEYFTEMSCYAPTNPYSASKASADHVVRAYGHTYGLPYTISNCSNNFGPYQYPEKMIPLMIMNMVNQQPLPVYGTGTNMRDWLFVEDHCRAIWCILLRGSPGQTYLVGSNNCLSNIELVHKLCKAMARIKGRALESYTTLIRFVADRPGHDRRYAIRSDRIRSELGWEPAHDFECALELTVRWYLENRQWTRSMMNRGYERWIRKNYTARQ